VRSGGGGGSGGVSIRALGNASSDAPRVIAPGQRWDTILQVDPIDTECSGAGQTGVATSDAASEEARGTDAVSLAATLLIGSTSWSSRSKGEGDGDGDGEEEKAPPIIQLHHAAAAASGRRGHWHGTGAGGGGRGGGGGVLDGYDLVLEWEEVRAPEATCTGLTDGPALRGAHHLRGIVAPDPASASQPHRHEAPMSRRTEARAAERARTAAAAAGLHDVRWTLEGPAVATLPRPVVRAAVTSRTTAEARVEAVAGTEEGEEKGERREADTHVACRGRGSVSGNLPSPCVCVSVTLRAHNPAPSPVRLTFEALTSGSSGRPYNPGGGGGGWAPIAGGVGWGDTTAVVGTVGVPTPITSSAVAPTPSAALPAPQCLPPGRPWVWAGPVRRTVTIASGATEDVPLHIAAYAPGTFVLDNYRVSWESVSSDNVGRQAAAGGGAGRGAGSGGAVGGRGNGGSEGADGGGDVAEDAQPSTRRSSGHPWQACNAPFIVSVVSPQQ
jgi:hypothetical protein